MTSREQLCSADRVREPVGDEGRLGARRRRRRADRLDPNPRRGRRAGTRGRVTLHTNGRDDMGLLRMAARTAVVAGTATAVSGRVAHRQNEKWAAQDQAAVRQQQAGSAGARRSRAAPAEPDTERRAPEPGAAAHAGRAHRRGVRGREGQGPGHLAASTVVRPVDAYTRLAGVYDEVVVDPCHGAWAGSWTALQRRRGRCQRRPRRLLRYRPAGGRAGRARLPRHRRRRLRGDARACPRAPRAGRRLIRATLPDLPLEGPFDAAVCTLDGFTYLAPADLRRNVCGAGPRLRPAAGSSSTPTRTR